MRGFLLFLAVPPLLFAGCSVSPASSGQQLWVADPSVVLWPCGLWSLLLVQYLVASRRVTNHELLVSRWYEGFFSMTSDISPPAEVGSYQQENTNPLP